jgi:hypothetical protein
VQGTEDPNFHGLDAGYSLNKNTINPTRAHHLHGLWLERENTVNKYVVPLNAGTINWHLIAT